MGDEMNPWDPAARYGDSLAGLVGWNRLEDEWADVAATRFRSHAGDVRELRMPWTGYLSETIVGWVTLGIASSLLVSEMSVLGGGVALVIGSSITVGTARRAWFKFRSFRRLEGQTAELRITDRRGNGHNIDLADLAALQVLVGPFSSELNLVRTNATRIPLVRDCSAIVRDHAKHLSAWLQRPIWDAALDGVRGRGVSPGEAARVFRDSASARVATEQFGDGVAARVRWTSRSRVASREETHSFRSMTDGRIVVGPNGRSRWGWWLGIALTVVIALGFVGFAVAKFGVGNGASLALAGVGLGLGTVFGGILWLARGDEVSFEFDPRRSTIRSSHGPVRAGQRAAEHSLHEAHALQLLRVDREDYEDGPYRSYELHVVLRDGSRVAVMPGVDLERMRSCARQLAAALKVELWDATSVNAGTP